ncbi:MAG: purine-nucleoside phosphorylase [Sphingobacteriales bacterium]|nr:purine-nucleoside phosphorylase [Sphingobacteriales bacterium]
MISKINEAVAYIQSVYNDKPTIGIVLGSGLGNFAKEITIEQEIPYSEIPHFPVSTVEGHSGKLIFGKLSGKKVVAMSGRFHFYEGYNMQEVVFPVRVMKFLGIETLLLSNAAGGVNPDLKVGDLMIITDHISQLTVNPLIGKNIAELGTRFPDMTEPYKKVLINKAQNIASAKGIPVKQGVYVGVTGPTFETKAEYLMIQSMGGDAVGMSTVPETIAAIHMGLSVFAMSVITDMGLTDEKITHEEVLKAAKAAEPDFAYIIKELVAQL